jgi:hypothetical protein
MLAITLTACGGGNGGASAPPSKPDAPFALSSVSVVDNAVNVPRDKAVVFNFTNPLNPSTVTAKSVTLAGPLGNLLPVGVSASGSDLLVGGGLGLPGNSRYRIDVAPGLSNAKGETLAGFSKTFTTAPQTWQSAPATVAKYENFSGSTRPLIQADSLGNVYLVWNAQKVGTASLHFARLDAKTGVWSAPQPIYAEGQGSGAGGVNLIASTKGELYLTWSQLISGKYVARMARYVPASGWAAPVNMPISPNIDWTGSHAIAAADPDGNLMVLGLDGRVYATRYNASTASWGTTERIDIAEDSDNYLVGAAIASDGNGNFIAAWGQQFKTAGRKPVVARYSNGKWSTSTVLDGYVYGGSLVPVSLSVNTAGQASLAWSTNEGLRDDNYIMVAYYTPASDNWAKPVRVTPKATVYTGGAYEGTAVIDAAGNITMTWLEGRALYARRLNMSTGSLSNAQRLDDGTITPGNAVAVVDNAGNVMVAFVQNQTMKASQFLVADGEWHLGTIGVPADRPYTFTNLPAVTIDAGGAVTVGWYALPGGGYSEGPLVGANRFR